MAAGCSDAGVGAGSGVGKDILPTVRYITLDNKNYGRNILYKGALLWNILPVYERNIQYIMNLKMSKKRKYWNF